MPSAWSPDPLLCCSKCQSRVRLIDINLQEIAKHETWATCDDNGLLSLPSRKTGSAADGFGTSCVHVPTDAQTCDGSSVEGFRDSRLSSSHLRVPYPGDYDDFIRSKRLMLTVAVLAVGSPTITS